MAEINRLTARGVAAITEPGRHADGGNLYLNVSKTGARAWVFFYRKDGKQREMGLGGYPAVGLAQAREAATEARRLLAQGGDPLAAKRAVKAEAKSADDRRVTFGAFAQQYIEAHEGEWKNEKHKAQWRSTILGPQIEVEAGKAKRKSGPDYCASLRKKPVSEIDTDDVLEVIRPYWGGKRETANRIRQRIETILDAAVVDKKRPSGLNPARWKGHLALLLPKQGRSRGHYAAMPWQSVPSFMAALADREGVAARAVELLILCASRSGEVRGMTWGEVDLDRQVWTIPGARMKAGREHRVPLSDRAISAVETMLPLRPRRAEDQPGALVFPGLRKAPLSDMTLGAVLKRMKVEGATIHGFRSAFRDWASEATSTPFEVVELALAHAVGDQTVQAYFRADLFEKRRALLDQWATYLSGGTADGGNVVPIRAGEA